MRLAVSNDGKELGEQKTVPTPRDDFEAGMRIFQEISDELTKGESMKAVAGGIAGTLDKEHTMAVRSPHMPGWVNQPLKKRMENLFSAPVHLENDAALAGLGEVAAGAGRGYGVAAYVTVSTGVGGARIVDGKIDRNASGFEIGHQIINYDGDLRTFEEYVSGSGFLKRFGKPPQEIMDMSIWEQTAHMLAYGMHNVIVHWSPEIIVIGGPLILDSPLPFESFKHHLTKSVLEVFPSVPEIKKAELGDRSGLWGALAYLRQNLPNSQKMLFGNSS